MMRHWNRKATVKWVHTANNPPNLGGNWKPQCQNCQHPCLKSQLGVIISKDEFQSQPCLTIYYTHDETLELTSCCEMGAHSQTHPILVWNMGTSMPKLSPSMSLKSAWGDHSR